MIQSPTMIAKTQSTTSELTDGTDPAWIRPWLRAEGLATFAAGLAGFLYLGLPWWAFRPAADRPGRVDGRLPARSAPRCDRLQRRS